MIRHIHVKECDSTQDILKEQLKQGPNTTNILVSCDHQLKGRGRGTHHWEDFPGSICFSLTVVPHPIVSFTAIELAVLVAKFFEGSILGVKWPNDLWNKHKKKCCGILVQTFGNQMVAGIGLNLFSDHPDFGGIYDSSFEFNKKAWALEIANYIINHRYIDNSALRKDWENRCGHIGQGVVISENGEDIFGIFLGIGKDGEAVLSANDGEKHIYNGSLRISDHDH